MTYGRTTIGKGVLIATLCAGPAGTVLFGLFAAIRWPGSVIDLTGRDVALIPVALFLSIPIGAVVAAVPNLIGTAALAMPGGRYPVARHPLIWSVAGLIAGAAIGRAMSGDVEPFAIAWLAATGLVCALLARWGTRWAD